MKIRISVLLIALTAALFFTPSAHAWSCPTGQIRQQAPAGTPTTAPFYDVVEGIAFVCVPTPTPEPPPTPAPPSSTSSASSAANSSSNSASSANASSNQSQSQKQNQTQTANGGTANATGGNASVGNVSSTSTVSNSGNSTLKNSGNSSNKNTNTATGGNQSQTSTSSANGNGVGNGNNSNDTVINTPHQTPPAIAAMVVPTAPCIKGGSIAGSGGLFSFGISGNKVDATCQALETSRMAPSILARCMIFIQTPYAKKAGVTLSDCLPREEVTVSDVVSMPVPQAPTITVNVPASTVIVIPSPVPTPVVDIAAAAAKVPHKHHTLPCPVTNDNINKP